MMSWRVAQSLDQLLAQINAAYPNRSRRSDGSIGDAAHASRSSDHNPWVRRRGVGIVTARDFTHDPTNGFNSWTFADRLRQECAAGRERRVKYIISNRRIASGTRGAWRWRHYSGSNPHSMHVHVSVSSEHSRYDDASPWSAALFGGKPGTGNGGDSSTGDWFDMATKEELRDVLSSYNPILDHKDFTNYMIWASREEEVQNNLADAAVTRFLQKELTCPDGEQRTIHTLLVWGYHRATQAAGQ